MQQEHHKSCILLPLHLSTGKRVYSSNYHPVILPARELEKVLGEYWLSLNGWGPGATKAPVGCRGNAPLGVRGGAKPPSQKRFWVFWRPVCCLSVHRNCENQFWGVFLALKMKIRTNISLLSLSQQFLKLPT